MLMIINLQMWCSKWKMLLNISKINYMIFYDKKKLPPPPNIQFKIGETPLTRVKKKNESLELVLMNNSVSHHMLNYPPRNADQLTTD